MKQLLSMFAVCACIGFSQQPPAAPATPAQQGGRGGGGQGGRGGGGAQPVNVRSNEQTGVDIDRYIGFAGNSPVHLSHATLLTHSILKAGDPYTPGPNGAVLEYRKDLSTATLLPDNRTPLLQLPDEYFFFVQSGQGRLDDGKQSWDLHSGLALLIPPNVPRRFVNTSDKPLEMIMLTWTAAGTPKNEITVRDVDLLPYCEENAHWNNMSKCIFNTSDGLYRGERMFVVMLQPWAMSQPHTHGPGTEEIWVKLTPGNAVMVLGSELREFPQNGAYLVPPTGITEHANLNLSKDKTEWWLYIARGAGQGQTPGTRAPVAAAPAPTEGRGRNPNIIRDQASVDAATVAGKPLR